ncbi:hypothetical protein DSY4788 [Desulfitobacterium hafniense Y51]|uniref:Uncharacterized protein n=1 Tax=Desulfitobacterium hafniense (strain Y51) TaxID=138119 RepID=Q24N15_DESHY|nr:hypothetical protein DSY4788 [Desulfitobacterium hafniense Y51]
MAVLSCLPKSAQLSPPKSRCTALILWASADRSIPARLPPTQLILFISSPEFVSATDLFHLGFHAEALRPPADKTDTGIRAAHVAGRI